MTEFDRSKIIWRKSSRSGAATECVEVAFAEDRVFVRDSLDPTGPMLDFSPPAWRAFLVGAKMGEFDPPAKV